MREIRPDVIIADWISASADFVLMESARLEPAAMPHSSCQFYFAQKIKPAYRPAMSKERAYHSDPEILGGTLVFKGTRVPVKSLFDHLKAGDSTGDFLEGFPSVKRSQVLAVLKEMETQVLTRV